MLVPWPIRLSPTPTICSVSPWTAGKGRRRRIEEAIRLILDCSENRNRSLIHVTYLTSGDGTVATKGKTKKPTARREAADETTSSERLTALVEESDALARIVAKNPSAPVSLLRVLSRSEDEATRKNVILNPFTPYDVLSELENQFTELFVNNPALESYNSMRL